MPDFSYQLILKFQYLALILPQAIWGASELPWLITYLPDTAGEFEVAKGAKGHFEMSRI